MTPRRLGKIKITNEVLTDALPESKESLYLLLSRFIPYAIEYDFLRNLRVYSGICDDFEEIEEGVEPPEYVAVFTHHEDKSISLKITPFHEWESSLDNRSRQNHG